MKVTLARVVCVAVALAAAAAWIARDGSDIFVAWLTAPQPAEHPPRADPAQPVAIDPRFG